MMDQSIYDLIDRAIRVAEREYEVKRTYAAAQVVTSLRKARAQVEVYETGMVRP
jgi:hypothetical protein